jgi:hypothetical protein
LKEDAQETLQSATLIIPLLILIHTYFNNVTARL